MLLFSFAQNSAGHTEYTHSSRTFGPDLDTRLSASHRPSMSSLFQSRLFKGFSGKCPLCRQSSVIPSPSRPARRGSLWIFALERARCVLSTAQHSPETPGNKPLPVPLTGRELLIFWKRRIPQLPVPLLLCEAELEQFSPGSRWACSCGPALKNSCLQRDFFRFPRRGRNERPL